MISMKGHRVVELSPRLKARITRLDGTTEEGTKDPYGLPWILEEGVAEYDRTLYTLLGARYGDPFWPIGRHSGHHGAHTEAGKGHIDLWDGLPSDMKGLWEYPVDTFFGEAAVFNFTELAPIETTPDNYAFSVPAKEGEACIRGQALLPEHFERVQEGDILLINSPFRGMEQPWLPSETSLFLALEKKIKLLAVGYPGIQWESAYQADDPHNSPTHRNMLGNNIPIAYPLCNIEQLTKERVFYYGVPLNVEKMDATWVRPLAFEEE
jgi:kynurenine formamidase